MRALLTIAALAVLALPASATAKLKPYVPPGNAGANEYVESVPTAGGSNSTGSVIQSPNTGSSLAASTESALTRAGADGRATAALANATAPPSLHRRPVHRSVAAGSPAGGSSNGGSSGGGSSGGGSSGGGSSSAGSSSAGAAGGAPVGNVLRSVVGLGQGGAALPAILISLGLALGAGRVWRRRTS